MPPLASAADPRTAAYCTGSAPAVFHGTVHGNQIWTPDPFDIESIHAEAREGFQRLLNRASSSEPPAHGVTLLLLGEAGSGKTHLMRAFRTSAHAEAKGYCGYLQMTTGTDNYPRYVLSNLIGSLEQPYKPGQAETGLQRLARGVLDALDWKPPEDCNALCNDQTLDSDELARIVNRLADLAVQNAQLKEIDIDLIRAMLFMLSNDGRVRPRVLKWLRCEHLGKYDRELIGDLVPRSQHEMPGRTMAGLGQLMHSLQSAALVFLVDQMEEMIDIEWHGAKRGEQFRSAINAVVDLADAIPNAVVVIGCLADLFVAGKEFLTGPKLDRLRSNPSPISLAGTRTEEEARAIVGRRLEVLFDAMDVPVDPAVPIAPFTDADLSRLTRLRSRDFLDAFGEHRRACIAAGHWLPFLPNATSPENPRLDPDNWGQAWNDFKNSHPTPIFNDESHRANLLAFAIRSVSAELPNGLHFEADPEERFIPVAIRSAEIVVGTFLVAMCEKDGRGGGLKRQIEETVLNAGERPAVFVRSTDFPKGANTQVMQELAKHTQPRGRGRKAVVADSDWRAMAAFREFHGNHHEEAGFSDWQRADRPLGELPSLHGILALDKLPAAPRIIPVPSGPSDQPDPRVAQPGDDASNKPEPLPPSVPTSPITLSDAIRIGETRRAIPAPVEIAMRDLCRHAAFLGGTGSGKTTAVLTIIEQLLLRGIPAVLIDRKGDLAQYANSAAWAVAEPDPDRAARRDQLRAAIDVQLYTPGAEKGRPLAIPIVPADIGELSSADRGQVAQYAAASLATMLDYKGKSPDAKLVILAKAIEVLGQSPNATVTLKSIQKLVQDRDDALTTSVDGFEDKHYKKLAEDLLALVHQQRRLLEGGELLDVDRLLGWKAAAVPCKTRLTIINTQFIGNPAATDFWISQLLHAVNRWREKNPTPREGQLQAVFLFDEADQYLPAVRQPASKGPMDSLLRRARSAGLGIFLATQSPGDFDYKCREQVLTWLIGKVTQTTAITKLKPMLEVGRVDAVAKLPGQEVGQFYLLKETEVSPIRVDQNLISTLQLSEEQIIKAACRMNSPRR